MSFGFAIFISHAVIEEDIVSNYDEHTSKRFDIELNAVKNSILQMGKQVSEQFRHSMLCVNNGDILLIQQVLDAGRDVNRMEVEIDHKCNLILAQRQPEANDLRLILTALKITTCLEQIGNQTELIARKAELLSQRGDSTLGSTDIDHSFNLVQDMLDKVLRAFSSFDADIADEVIRQDIQVGKESNFTTRNLVSRMLEDPRLISSALDFLFISKAIELIGNQAKNIAEYTIFMVQGIDVRHTRQPL